MLSGLTTAELTLTKRGANNRRFAMIKGGIPMDPEVLQALIGTPAEGEDLFVKTLKSQGVTDEEKVNAAIAQFRIQKGMKDLVDNDVMDIVTKAAGYTVKAVDANEGADKKKPDATSGKVDPKAKQGQGPVKKSIDLSQLDDDSRQMVEAVFKSHDTMAEKSTQLEAVVKSLSTEVDTLKDEKQEAVYVAKAAKDFSHLPMADKELGLMLKSANAVSPDFAKGFESLLGKMDEMVAKSDMLTTMGAASRQASGGAWDKIQTLAKGMVQKSLEGGNTLSNAQAIDLVLKTEQGAALYREYLGDNPKQRADVY
jgi:hypothetical protein